MLHIRLQSFITHNLLRIGKQKIMLTMLLIISSLGASCSDNVQTLAMQTVCLPQTHMAMSRVVNVDGNDGVLGYTVLLYDKNGNVIHKENASMPVSSVNDLITYEITQANVASVTFVLNTFDGLDIVAGSYTSATSNIAICDHRRARAGQAGAMAVLPDQTLGVKTGYQLILLDTDGPFVASIDKPLRLNDIVVYYDGIKAEYIPDFATTSTVALGGSQLFRDYLSSRPIGSTVKLSVYRPATKTEKASIFDASMKLLDYTFAPSEVPNNATVAKQWLDNQQFADDEYVTFLFDYILKNPNINSYNHYLSMLNAIRLRDNYKDPYRNPVLRYVYRDPAKSRSVVQYIADDINSVTTTDKDAIPSLIKILSKKAALPYTSTQQHSATGCMSKQSCIDYIKQVVTKAYTMRNKALAKVDLGQIYPVLGDIITRGLTGEDGFSMITKPSDVVTIDNYKKILRSVGDDIDYDLLLQSSAQLSLLSDPGFLAQLKQVFANNKGFIANTFPISGNVLYAKNFVLDKKNNISADIIIGSTQDNTYNYKNSAKTPMQIIFDLGGNDTYTADTGRVSNVVNNQYQNNPLHFNYDYGGNDLYKSFASKELDALGFSIGSALFGTSLVVNAGGNDRYIGGNFSQGTSFAGVGMLIDTDGDDLYNYEHKDKQFMPTPYVQGIGYFGIGALYDKSGSDRYYTGYFGQGAGAPKGIGLLLDHSGNDTYDAYGLVTGFDDDPWYSGFAQGFGFGFRLAFAGGIGILIDNQGKDTYTAGDASIAMALNNGIGIVVDGAGDDKYTGKRYGISAPAHSSAGILIDKSGNDTYSIIGGNLVGNAFSWDRSLALLIDQAGNDAYRVRQDNHKIGSKTTNGLAYETALAMLIDYDGVDTYELDDRRVSNLYHGLYSIAAILDVGKQIDHYLSPSKEPFKNYQIYLDNYYGAAGYMGDSYQIDLDSSLMDAKHSLPPIVKGKRP